MISRFSVILTALAFTGIALAEEEPFEKLGQVIRTPLGPGVQHIHLRTKDPLSIHIVEVDPKSDEVEIDVALAQDRIGAEETVSSIAARKDALVAVNAGFPVGKNQAPGLIVADGELLSSPSYRTAFGVTRDGVPSIAKWTDRRNWKAKIITPEDAVRELGPMNFPCREDEITLFTPAFGSTSPGAGKHKITEILLDESRRVKEIRTGGEGFPLSAGQLVLAGCETGSSWLQDHFKKGENVTLDLRSDPPWQDLHAAVAAGPLLLRSGTYLQDPEETYPDGEDLDPEYKKKYYSAKLSRSAAGYNRDKTRVYFVVVDGQQPKFSVGVTQKKFGDLLRQMDIYHALELGCGADVTMVVNGNVVNEPVFKSAKDGTGGTEKPVTGALLVLKR